VTQQQCYWLETLKMCTFGWVVRFACCAGCEQYLWSPIPLVTTPSAQTASGSHMTEASPAVPDASPEPQAVQASGQHPTSTAPLGGETSAEPAAVQASGQHTTSTAPLSGETSAELPSGAASEEAPSITADSARNASPARADTTVGKTLPCTACMCAKGVAGYSDKLFTLLSRQHDLYNSCHIMAGHMISTITQPAYTIITTLAHT